MKLLSRRIIPAIAVLSASIALAADPPKPKTELVLDTPEKALKSYITCWQNTDYVGIMACIKISDKKLTPVVERYVNYMMWCDALERTAAKKWGDEEAMKILSHVRTLEKQYELDIKKRAINANVDYQGSDKTKARVFLRVEAGRPENLATDELFFRDDYYMEKDGGGWKIDFLKTHKLDIADKEQEVAFYANNAFPALIKKMKELAEGIKADKIASAEIAKDDLANTWSHIPGAASTDPDADPTATQPGK